MAVFLVGAASGGVLFGWLGDKIGRVRAMSLSIVTYAVLTGMCGFATQAWQIAVLRFIASLGMGGEWSLGVALVNEIWPGKSRAFIAGLIGAAQGSAAERPNIVIILADDLGNADLGYRGSPIQPPHIDALAREGVRLESYYGLPVCTSARAALMLTLPAVCAAGAGRSAGSVVGVAAVGAKVASTLAAAADWADVETAAGAGGAAAPLEATLMRA